MKQVIINAASALYNIDGSKVFEPGRKQPFVGIRQMVCYFLHEELNWSYNKIAEFIDKDRCTAISAVKAHQDRLDVYGSLRKVYANFKKLYELESRLINI